MIKGFLIDDALMVYQQISVLLTINRLFIIPVSDIKRTLFFLSLT